MDKPSTQLRVWRSSASVSGFSRTGLLTVVAAALLLGVTGWAFLRTTREKTRQVACLQNVHELCDAFLNFNDTTGLLPNAARKGKPLESDWVFWQPDRDFAKSAVASYLAPFAPARLRCPLDTLAPERNYAFTYAMFAHMEHSRASKRGPTGRILLAEEEQPNDGCWAAGLNEDFLTRRHSGRASVAFADGHAQFLRTDFTDEQP